MKHKTKASNQVSFEIEPEFSGISEARHFIEKELTNNNMEYLVDVAMLVTSELVTNAVIHAKTHVEISLEKIENDTAQITVKDYSPTLVLPKDYDVDALTGRGLILVGRVALDWGVALHDDSKEVWVKLGRESLNFDNPLKFDLSEWDLDDNLEETENTNTVKLVNLPVDVYKNASQRLDDLKREFLLIAAQSNEVPKKLLKLADELNTLQSVAGEANKKLIEAVLHKEEKVTLEAELPTEMAEVCENAVHVLNEADVYCEKGKNLLTLAANEEQKTFRYWFFGQITDQLRDHTKPVAWEEYLLDRQKRVR